MKKIVYTSCIAQLDTSIRNCTLTAAGVRLISGWSLNTCRPATCMERKAPWDRCLAYSLLRG
nr:MAG TPA: hypothetical protein [Caudoviricetes sp.]DAU78111.1 MAG TPA: hypothetical protein [Caudoviricetes sp.]